VSVSPVKSICCHFIIAKENDFDLVGFLEKKRSYRYCGRAHSFRTTKTQNLNKSARINQLCVTSVSSDSLNPLHIFCVNFKRTSFSFTGHSFFLFIFSHRARCNLTYLTWQGGHKTHFGRKNKTRAVAKSNNTSFCSRSWSIRVYSSGQLEIGRNSTTFRIKRFRGINNTFCSPSRQSFIKCSLEHLSR